MEGPSGAYAPIRIGVPALRSAAKRVGGPELQLQSLRLAGFKTFASPTVIEFADGITAIVGANGSGKSNIVDALKWVLGEQSLRDLRSRKAEDVIFSGSQSRKPGSMAEVSISFGNESQWLPLEASEVELMRRLYRSAEGEYVINQERVRLRDILDLVRLGGLDAGGHTIVGQGLVDSVLSLRGVERRSYIAAVAGVAPYEARRDEAIRSLEQTRQNVAGAQIVYDEIEPRLRLLRRQANLAENALAAKTELTEALRFHYRRQWAKLEQSRSEAISALGNCSTELSALREAAHQLESEQQAFQTQLNRIRTERDVRRDRFLAAEYGLKRAEDGRAAAGVAQGRLAAELERLEQQLATMQRSDELDVALESVDSRTRLLQARRTELIESLDAAGREAGQIGLARDAAAEQKEAAAAELVELRRASDRDLRRRDHLEVQLEQAMRRLSAEKIDLPKLSVTVAEAEAGRDEKASLSSAASESQDDVRRVREAMVDAAREAREALAAVEDQRAELARTLERRVRSRAELADGSSKPGLTVADVLNTPPDLAAVTAAALGSLSETISGAGLDQPGGRPGPKPESAWRAQILDRMDRASVAVVGWLDDQLGLSSDSAPPTNTLAACLVLADPGDLERAWTAVADLAGGPIGQVPLMLLSPDGSCRAAGRRSAPSPRDREPVDRRVALAEIDREIAQLQEREGSLEAVAAERRLCARSADEALRTAEQTLERAVMRDAEARAEAASAESLFVRLQAELEERRHAFDAMTSRVDLLQAEVLELEGQGDVAGRAAAIEESVSTADRNLFEAAEARVVAETKVRDLNGEVALLNREIEIEQGERRRLARLHEAVGRERTDLMKLIQETLEASRRAESTLTAASDSVESASIELEAARIGLAEAPQEPQAAVPDAFAKLHALRGRIEAMIGEEQKFRSELEYLDGSLERLLAECSLDLDLHPSVLPDPDESREYAEVEIRRLRVRAEQAADVDPGAAQEYRDLAARKDHLEEQLTDLREASDTLETMLRDADREVRRRFRMTFTHVNDLFVMFFKDIFGGGAAELVLETSDEVESVEIAAQLPGKRARDLSGLSGGERTLVAGAFLFALVSASPPPFCVLDEVDAALDETNVDRYLGVLRQLAEQTQFVVVTHNRGTMAAANTLYGIVLDPNAGSRALSLRLDEAVAG